MFSSGMASGAVRQLMVSVWTFRLSGSTPLASAIHFAAASLMALEVMVAPETASTSLVWASRMVLASSSAATPPMLSVSPEASMTTSVIFSASKVMVTETSPLMPAAVAV